MVGCTGSKAHLRKHVAVSGSLKGSASGGVVLTLTTRPAITQVETSGGAVVRNP